MSTSILCPRCGKPKMDPVEVRNALSRRDNKTYICSDCGTAEAFVDMGWQKEVKWDRPLDLLEKGELGISGMTLEEQIAEEL